MAVVIYDFWNGDDKDHTWHQGEEGPNECRQNVQFYAFSKQVKGSEPVYDFFNAGDKDHTYHFGEGWPNEEKGNVQFYAFNEQRPGTQPVYDFWNAGDNEHTFHFGEAWFGREEKGGIQFYVYPEQLSWNAAAECDGHNAADRAQWLMDNEGMDEETAQQQVMSEYPAIFSPGAINEESATAAEAVDGKFPHTLRLVKDGNGNSRLQIAVTPNNPDDVSLVAVHYGIDSDEMSMNFDITHREPGTATYTHTTPDFGPVCEAGSVVKYWLAAVVNGPLEYMPEDLISDPESRLTWTAQ